MQWKKLIGCACASAMLLSIAAMPLAAGAAAPSAVWAADDGEWTEPETLTYNGMNYYIEDNKATITGYTDDLPSVLEIPAEIGGIPVTGIGQMAFYNAPITEVTIPASIESFGFQNFMNCTKLSKVNLPANLKAIHEGAFGGCTALESIDLPEGLTTIGNLVFSGCTALKEIGIPSTLTEFGEPAFTDTPWLAAKQAENPFVVINGVLIDGSTVEGGEITVPDGVKSVAYMAFADRKDITKVTLPDSMESLGRSAFGGCTALAEIVIPAGVTEIGHGAFDGTAWLTAQQEKNPVVVLNSVVIDGTTAVGGVVIPEGATVIGDFAFYCNEELTGVTFPDSLTKIGADAFSACSELTEVTIPVGVTAICDSAFCRCESLADITIVNPNCEITDNSFTIANDWSNFYGTIHGYAGSTAEAYAKKYDVIFKAIEGEPPVLIEEPTESVTEPTEPPTDPVTEPTEPATEPTEPAEKPTGTCGEHVNWEFDPSTGTLTISGTGAMEDYNGYIGTAPTFSEYRDQITSVVIEEGVTTLGSEAFSCYENLVNVTIPESVTRIKGGALMQTAWMTAREAENLFVVVNGLLISARTCTGDVTVPDGVVMLEEGCFAQNENVTSVTLPEGVKRIGRAAFETCFGLTSVQLPDSLEVIEEGAFNLCSKLTDVTIPAGVKQIGDNVFLTIESLASVTILNPDCEIYDSMGTFCNTAVWEEGVGGYTMTEANYTGVIRGHAGSTAEAYAKKYGRTFEEIQDEPTETTLGDIDGTGTVNASDAANVLIAAAAIGASKDPGLTDAQKKAADVNSDGSINATDAAIILQYAAYVGAGHTDAKITDFVH